ncbi:MAG: hypothetical protein Q4C77_19885 [Eubacteriales bacterium]|nr:hypothetical protein [Eubacteriales bacterium]
MNSVIDNLYKGNFCPDKKYNPILEHYRKSIENRFNVTSFWNFRKLFLKEILILVSVERETGIRGFVTLKLEDCQVPPTCSEILLVFCCEICYFMNRKGSNCPQSG